MGRLLTGALVLVLGGGVAALLVAPRLCWHGDVFPDETAKMKMMRLQTAIEMYRRQRKQLPTRLEDLTVPTPDDPEPYLETIDKDPWGNAFDYRPGERGRFTLRSWGEDGRPGTDDDLTWPEPRAGTPGRADPPAPGRGPRPGGG